ncbi:MAG: BREX-2 system phosphatase PglZ [Rhodospirillales bacterium]|nr:BREX-2 system phosphatase PglZ [Rhodospirillales bacterium]
MSVRAPSAQQIGAQIDEVLHRNPRARLIGIRSPLRRPWPERIERNGASFHLIWCASALEMRERIAELEDTSDGGLVVVTNLEDTALGDDLAARFARGRLLQANRWQMLRTAFQAHAVDPRLRGQEWIAELLLDHAPPGGYPPVAGGVLDADTAWRHLLDRSISLADPRPDVDTLLRWTLNRENLSRFTALPEPTQRSISARLAETAGATASLVVSAVSADRGADTLPLGLVCGVIFANEASSPELHEAAVRLEPYFGGQRIPREVGQILADAANRVATRLDDAEEVNRHHERAARILTDLHIAAYAGLSPVLTLGFDARLRACAEALHAALDAPGEERHADVESTASCACVHEQAARNGDRIERLRMAVRLLRWLKTPEVSQAADFATIAGAYAREGGFVDLARLALPDDELAELAAAYGRLGALARTRRERENQRFAEALQVWNETDGGGDDVLPVESVLERVVAPLARQSPLLLAVLDGLSFAVHRRILPVLLNEGYIELVPQGRGGGISGYRGAADGNRGFAREPLQR